MKFLIETRDNRTIEADLADVAVIWPEDDVLYFCEDENVSESEITPYRLSTARSLEVEAMKEAAELFVDIMKRNDIADDAESILDWLKKWGEE